MCIYVDLLGLIIVYTMMDLFAPCISIHFPSQLYSHNITFEQTAILPIH